MRTHFRLSAFISSELVVETATEEIVRIIVIARGDARIRSCPRCGMASTRAYGRFRLTFCDLPCCGRRVELRVAARRFVRTQSSCEQKHLGLAFGDRPAASFAKRMMLPVSTDK